MKTTSIKGVSRSKALESAKGVLQNLNYEIVDFDNRKAYILAQKRFSPLAFAREIFIELFPSGTDGVRVLVQMRSIAMQLGNWEQNREKELEFVAHLKQALKPRAQAS